MLRQLAHWLVAKPQVYDLVQWVVDRGRSRIEAAPFLGLTAGRSVLDIGAGTGLVLEQLAPDTRYIWLDNDLQKLAGFRQKHGDLPAVIANGDRLCFPDKSIDFGLCLSISHHCSDEVLDSLFREIARVTTAGIIVAEPLRVPSSLMSRVLWHYDRGEFPRTEDELLGTLGQYFRVERKVVYSVYHTYLICHARPK